MAEPNWIWKETAEVIGVLGIVGSLIFVAFEIRQNNDLMEADARFAHMEARASWFELLASDPQIIGLIAKDSEGETLSLVEQGHLIALYNKLFTQMEWEVQEGEFRGRFAIPLNGYRSAFGFYPGIRESWEQDKLNYAPEFVRFVDDNVINQAN
jgi:hypothetical protein